MERSQNVTIDSEHRTVFSTVLLGLVLGMIVIIIIFGNVLVCLVVGLNRKLQNQTNYFIVSLAATDLLLGLLVLPFSAISELLESEWPFGDTFCNIYTSMDVMLSTASILNLFMISLDRYYAVTSPLRYTTLITPNRVAISLSLIWCISIMVSFLPINLGWNTKDLLVQSLDNTNQCHLELNKVYALVDALITFYIPLPIMCLTYYRIFKIAREQAKRINNVTGCTTLNPSLPTVKEHKATVTLATVMGVFVICWLPYFVVFTHEGISGHPTNKTVFAVVLWLGYVNSALNPILYAALNRDFRKAYQKLLRCGERNLYYRDSPGNLLTCQPLNSSLARTEQCQQLGQEVTADNELNSEDSNGENVPLSKETSERDFVTSCGRSAEMICYCRDLWLTKVRLMKNLWSPENEETEVEPMGSQRMLDPGH
ncbi:histamine H2 receptor-like [Scyliorhinus canicula]|uniref:histamine H2 receptor-like n=1 Tax=Scyliorhinus canicula TaxID=7830 RepID=UPI0018F48005|nr:histamine H2 receptor-like [Scyliorhinus canicula]XP_038651521.1 histamine H2 receptor-like [Scyliorhinus canicula]XP_038651522.1 histamine H2 receptor-like [Scyliorhinus canicula]